jgi:hypothetical protein
LRTGTVGLAAIDQGDRRFNAGFYVSVDSKLLSATRGWHGKSYPLSELASVYAGGIFRRTYVEDPGYGVPYVSASDLDRTDYPGRRLLSRRHGGLLEALALTPGMTVITCSGVNLGWAMLVRPDMAGFVGSHDLIRVVAADTSERDYLAAYLCSRPGWLSIRSLIYGTSIKHIGAEAVERLGIPWLPDQLRHTVAGKFREAAERRASSMHLIDSATRLAFQAIGLEDLVEGEWQRWGRDLSFAGRPLPRSLRAWNFAPRAARLYEHLASVKHKPLPSWTRDGTPSKGPSPIRIDAMPPHGVQLISQRQLFRFVPDGRMIAKRYIGENHRARPGTTLIASRGTFGDAEVFGRTQYVSELASGWVYSNDILRVVAAEPIYRGWLYAILRSQSAFRLLRSFATGSKQQDLHPELLAEMPIPEASDSVYLQVQALVDQAFGERDAAYEAEREAKVAILEAVLNEPA